MNLKENKRKLILSSIVILLPIVFGLLIWDKLPDVMTTHWGVDNQADGWSSKSFAVFGFPFLLLAIHWLGMWITAKDPGQKNQSKKALGMIFWMVPAVSLVTSAMMYGIALGNTVNIGSVLFGMMGLMFVGIGNYLPKVKQNYSLGIKVTWALRSEENWNATHRFGGKVWVIGGFFLVLAAFFPVEYSVLVMLPTIFVLALVPTVYSYLYYKKMCKEGRGYDLKMPEMDKTTKIIYRISMVVVAIILIVIFFIMFTGKINYVYGTDSFTVDATFHDDLTVAYDVIDTIELRKEPVPGTREFGFGSARLLLGIFKNEEFGLYTRYTYTNCESAVVLNCEGKTLVLAGRTPEETEILYNTLLSKTR